MSGLQIKISAEEQKDSFILFDCTGIFKFDNLGGWGNPNARMDKVTKATLFVRTPKTPDTSEPIAVDLTGNIPNFKFIGVEILPFQIGLAKIVSGKYTLKLEITGIDSKGVTYTKHATIIKIMKNDVICCVDKLQKLVDKDAFKDETQKKVIELLNLVESLDYADEHDLIDNAVSIIDYLNEQCVCPGC